MSDSRIGMCLVQKSAPSTPVQSVESRHREALESFFKNPVPSVSLLKFLDDLHAHGRWIVCDCLGPEIPVVERPALTVAKSPKGNLFLRNLQSRRLHADHCPFRYEPGKRPERIDESGEEGATGGLAPGKPLNLHVATAVKAIAPSAPGKAPDLIVQRKPKEKLPRLGQVLLHLMREAGMLGMSGRFDFLQGIKDMRSAAEDLIAYSGVSLNDVLAVSCKHEQSLIRRVKEERETHRNAYAVLVVVVHQVQSGPATLLRFDGNRKVAWKVSPRGEVKVWSRRSINKGPFLAAITYAPSAGEEEPVAQNAFLLPIVDTKIPMPVESDIERVVARSLLNLSAWYREKRSGSMIVEKPMSDIKTPSGECRPDFMVRGPNGRVVIEVMGMSGQAEYDERKARTVPIMRELGEVMEITKVNGDREDSKAQLQAMNRWVLSRVGRSRPGRSAQGPVFQEM